MKRHMTKTSANLSLEALEDRQLLSTAAFILFRTLYIQGDANADNVKIEGFFSGMDITTNRDEHSYFAHSRFDRVVVNLGEGSDSLKLVNTHSPAWGPDDRNLDMDINLGGGDDVAFFFTDSNSRFQGVNLDIDLQAGAGVDQIYAHIPKLYDANLDMDFDLGTEGDYLYSFLSGRLFAGSHATINARGSLGADELNFESTYFAPPHETAIDSSSALTVKLFGQKQADIINTRLESVLGSTFDGRVELYGHGGEGRDIITTNVDRNVNSDGNMYVDVVGAKGNDRLTLNLNETTFGNPVAITPMPMSASFLGGIVINPGLEFEIVPTVRGQIDGSVGFDFYAKTPNVNVINCEALIGGPFDIFFPPGDDGILSR